MPKAPARSAFCLTTEIIRDSVQGGGDSGKEKGAVVSRSEAPAVAVGVEQERSAGHE